MKTTAFDARFDAGNDISAEVDWAKARCPDIAAKRVNVDLPGWVQGARPAGPTAWYDPAGVDQDAGRGTP